MLRNRNNYTSALILLFICCSFFKAQAVLGPMPFEAYKNLVHEIPDSDAACCVIDEGFKFLQSGVLVKPNIIMTAAHGMQSLIASNKCEKIDLGSCIIIKPKKMYVRFANRNGATTYPIKSIIIDGSYVRYEEGQQHKFDIAFLKTAMSVDFTEPVELQEKISVEQDVPMAVVTWGNSDLKDNLYLKRAFYLYEWTIFYPFTDEDITKQFRRVMIGSLFFRPYDSLPIEPSMNDSEGLQRNYYALRSWLRHGKKPYAMALPGTSGAPVFVQEDGQLVLFGAIMGYSSVADKNIFNDLDYKKLLNTSLENAYNFYQTIIATPYRLNTDPVVNTVFRKEFVLDTRYTKMLEILDKNQESFT